MSAACPRRAIPWHPAQPEAPLDERRLPSAGHPFIACTASPLHSVRRPRSPRPSSPRARVPTRHGAAGLLGNQAVRRRIRGLAVHARGPVTVLAQPAYAVTAVGSPGRGRTPGLHLSIPTDYAQVTCDARPTRSAGPASRAPPAGKGRNGGRIQGVKASRTIPAAKVQAGGSRFGT